MESNSKDARNCREFINSSEASEIKILYAFKHYQSTRMRHSHSLKAKISENVGIFVLALKRKKCVFSLCSHASETFQTAKTKKESEMSQNSSVPEFIDPRFRENKPKMLVFSH
jgi:hypothetical protein